MKHLTWLLLFPVLVLANDPPPFRNQVQDQEQAQNQVQNQNQSQVANGGLGGSSSQSTSQRFYALAGNITQVQISECLVPAKGRGRSWSVLWGIFSISGYSEMDQECVASKLAMLELQAKIEAEKAALLVAKQSQCDVSHRRVEEAWKECIAK